MEVRCEELIGKSRGSELEARDNQCDRLWQSLITIYEDETNLIDDGGDETQKKIWTLIAESLKSKRKIYTLESIVLKQTQEIDEKQEELQNNNYQVGKELREKITKDLIQTEVIAPFLRQITDDVIYALENAVDSNSIDNQELHESVHEIKLIHDDLHKKIEEQDIKIKQLNEEKVISEESNKTMFKQLKNMEEEITKNKENYSHEIMIMREENDSLQLNLNNIMEIQKTEADSANQEFQAKIEDLMKDIALFRQENESLKCENSENIERISCLEQQIVLNNEHSVSNCAVENPSFSHEELNKQLSEQLKFINEEYFNLQTEFNEFKLQSDIEINKLRINAEIASNSVESLQNNQAVCSDLEKYQNQIKILKEDIEVINGELAKEKQENEQIEKIYCKKISNIAEDHQNELKAEKELFIAHKLECENNFIKINQEKLELKNLIKDSQEDIKTISVKLSICEKDNEKMLETNNELQTRLQYALKEKEDIIGTKAEIKIALEETKNKHGKLELEYEEMAKKSVDEVKKLKSEIDSLKNQLLESKSNLENEKLDTENVINRLQIDIKGLKDEYESRLSDFSSINNKLNVERQKIISQMMDCQDIIKSLKDENISIQTDLNKQNELNSEIEQKLVETLQKNGELDAQIIERNNQIVNQTHEINELINIKKINKQVSEQIESEKLKCRLITEDKERLGENINRLKAKYKQKCELLKAKQIDIDDIQPTIRGLNDQIKTMKVNLDEQVEALRVKERDFNHLKRNYQGAKDKILQLKSERGKIRNADRKPGANDLIQDNIIEDDGEKIIPYLEEPSINKISFHKTPIKMIGKNRTSDIHSEENYANQDVMTSKSKYDSAIPKSSLPSEHKRSAHKKARNINNKQKQFSEEKENIGDGGILDRISFLAKQSTDADSELPIFLQKTPIKSTENPKIQRKSLATISDRPFTPNIGETSDSSQLMQTPRTVKRSKSVLGKKLGDSKATFQSQDNNPGAASEQSLNHEVEDKKEKSCMTH